jgi:hypothetical protein
MLGEHFPLSGQHSLNKYTLPPIHDPVMPLLTNRQIDTISPGHYNLLNEIDVAHSLKLFRTEIIGDSIYCRLTDENFLAELFSEPCQDWLLLIHGDSKAPVDAAVRGLEIQNTHDVKVITFSWPSKMDTRDGLKNFRNSNLMVEEGMPQFRELLLTLQKYKHSPLWPEGNRLSLLLHSLGNYYLELGVKEEILEGLDTNLFDNIVINAAAIDQEDHAEWLEQLNISKRIYITLNKGDFNLRGARLFTSAGTQLGAIIEPPLAPNASYIHFTEAVGFKMPTWLSHTYFVGDIPSESDNIRDFYRVIFHGEEADLSDEAKFHQREDGMGYDIQY